MLFKIIMGTIAATLIILITADIFMTKQQTKIIGFEKGNIAQIVWYTTFILAIGATVMRLYHKKKIQALKHGAIWIAIALVILVFYTFRYEIKMISGQTIAALIPGTPYSYTHQGENIVTLRAEPGGQFEAKAQVNGININMLVDTGASAVAITYQDAKKIGINTEILQYNIPLYTANGIALAAKAKLKNLSVGGINIKNVNAFVAQKNAMRTNLLGMNWLARLKKFEFQNDKLILVK